MNKLTNKLTLALALGTSLSLGAAVPTSAVAATIKTNQTLPTTELSADAFRQLFQPIDNAPALSESYQFLGSPVAGTIRSQVFAGDENNAAVAGKYAYVYQISVNDVKSEAGDSVYVDSVSYKFNDTPLATNFAGGDPVYAYTVSGGLLGPDGTEGQVFQKPASVSWISNEVTGALRVHFVDPDTETPPLDAGSNSAAFVVISDAPLPSSVAKEFVNLQSDSPTAGDDPSVYAASGGDISPVPVPEPSTVLAWTGMIGALALVRRVRKNRPSA